MAMLQCRDKIIDHFAAYNPLLVGESLMAVCLLRLHVLNEIRVSGNIARNARKIFHEVLTQVDATPSHFSKFISVLQEKRLNDLAKTLQDKLSKCFYVFYRL